MRLLIHHIVAPFVITFSLLSGATDARPQAEAQQAEAQQAEAQPSDRAVIQRRVPEAGRERALAFIRTELFFGTAKAEGEPVTDEEFRIFIDEVVTPLFPDGLTVVAADGQFRGNDGETIKERSYQLILLYPLESQKVSSKDIDAIRRKYRRQHQQESVLRVDDPFVVWVSF